MIPLENFDSKDWKTFQSWSDAGYLIIKGSKGTKINGYWQFHKSQVKEKEITGDVAYDNRLDWQD